MGPTEMNTPNNAAALERLDKLIQGLAEQQAMPDDAWRIEYAEIRKTLAKMHGGGRADDLALEVARRFTLDTEPQRRASMQCAVADAIKRSGLPPTDDSEGWDGEPSYQDLIDYVTAPTKATQPDALTGGDKRLTACIEGIGLAKMALMAGDPVKARERLDAISDRLDALTSQPSGEADDYQTRLPGDYGWTSCRRDWYEIVRAERPQDARALYTRPPADAPAGVNSSLRVAALALADLAERNTDDLDLWQAAIAAVRNAADAPGVAVDEWRPIESAPAGVPILVRYINRAGKERVIKARFIQRFTEESSGDCDEGVDEYDEANDRYTYCEGWWEMIDNWDDFAFIAVSEGSPTHWHKIPSTAALAPKQEGGHG